MATEGQGTKVTLSQLCVVPFVCSPDMGCAMSSKLKTFVNIFFKYLCPFWVILDAQKRLNFICYHDIAPLSAVICRVGMPNMEYQSERKLSRGIFTRKKKVKARLIIKEDPPRSHTMKCCKAQRRQRLAAPFTSRGKQSGTLVSHRRRSYHASEIQAALSSSPPRSVLEQAAHSLTPRKGIQQGWLSLSHVNRDAEA